MTEQAYQKKITDKLTKAGAYVVKVVVASKKGVPDILCCYRGKFIGIEVKKPETIGNTTKLQDYNLAQIKKAGGMSIVACSFDQIEPLLFVIDTEEDHGELL